MANKKNPVVNKKNHSIEAMLWKLLTNPYVLILGITLIFIWILWSALLSKDQVFLNSLEKVEAARGLITFLIAFCTVAIAMILALYPIITQGKEWEKRFTLAKEILTILLTVLTGIVGYYFGTSKEANPIQGIQVARAIISGEQHKIDGNTNITSFISGGTPPYTYSIEFSPNVIPAIKDAVSLDGWIKQDVLIPTNLHPGTEVNFVINIRDVKGKSTSYKNGKNKLSISGVSEVFI